MTRNIESARFICVPISYQKLRTAGEGAVSAAPHSCFLTPLEVQVLDQRRVLLDELAARFNLVARQHEGSWVFQAWIDFEDLYVGKNIDPALLENQIAAINEKSKKLLADNPENDPIYTSWRVGDTLKPETRGNFE